MSWLLGFSLYFSGVSPITGEEIFQEETESLVLSTSKQIRKLQGLYRVDLASLLLNGCIMVLIQTNQTCT